MERQEEDSIPEGLRKRERPNPQVDTTTVDEYLANEEKFWDELMRGSGARPTRKDSEHAEGKTAWMKMDLETEMREAVAAAAASAAACLSEDEDDEPGYELRRFRDRWKNSWSGADRCGEFEDTSKLRSTCIRNM